MKLKVFWGILHQIILDAHAWGIPSSSVQELNDDDPDRKLQLKAEIQRIIEEPDF